jgi:hypothetical protein
MKPTRAGDRLCSGAAGAKGYLLIPGKLYEATATVRLYVPFCSKRFTRSFSGKMPEKLLVFRFCQSARKGRLPEIVSRLHP